MDNKQEKGSADGIKQNWDCHQSACPPGLTTPSHHLALQSLPARLSLPPCCIRVLPGPGRTWQDRPWPVLLMLAHGNAIWLVWMITTATAGWPAASRNQGHSTSALRTFLALFSSACRWIIHPVQLGDTNVEHDKKKTCMPSLQIKQVWENVLINSS